jgi:endoglucanase
MKAFALLLVFSAVLLLCSAGYVSQHGSLQTKGRQIVDKNGQPVMLRGVSLFWSQWMGQFWNYNVLATLKNDWHINVIRAAMGVEEGGYLSNPAKEKQRVIDVVEAAIKLDLYVIIDWHDHNGQSHTDQAVQFFTEMAQRYGNRPNVIFETYNEPLDWVNWSSTLKPYHNRVVGAIRKYSNNLVVCGTRTWSQRVDEAARDPLPFKNIAYTLHFYSGTHRQDLRNIAQAALNMNAPIFVTECGVSEASGNGNFDKAEFDKWLGFMESNKISWVVWALDDKAETSALLKPGANSQGKWDYSGNLSPAGRYIRDTIRSKQ